MAEPFAVAMLRRLKRGVAVGHASDSAQSQVADRPAVSGILHIIRHSADEHHWRSDPPCLKAVCKQGTTRDLDSIVKPGDRSSGMTYEQMVHVI